MVFCMHASGPSNEIIVEGDIAKAAKGIGSKGSVAFDAEGFAHEMASQLVDITGAWIKEYVPQ